MGGKRSSERFVFKSVIGFRQAVSSFARNLCYAYSRQHAGVPFGCLAENSTKPSSALGSGCVKMHVITHFLFLTTKQCSFFIALDTKTLHPTAKRRHAIEEV
jgi:hypothetical protein